MVEAPDSGGTAIEMSPQAIRETLEIAKDMAAKVEAIATRAGEGPSQLGAASTADGSSSMNKQRSTKAVMFRQVSAKGATVTGAL